MYKCQTFIQNYTTVHKHTCMQSTWKCGYLDEPHISLSYPLMINDRSCMDIDKHIIHWQQYHRQKKVWEADSCSSMNAVGSTNQILPEIKHGGQTWKWMLRSAVLYTTRSWPPELTHWYFLSNYTDIYMTDEITHSLCNYCMNTILSPECVLSHFHSRCAGAGKVSVSAQSNICMKTNLSNPHNSYKWDPWTPLVELTQNKLQCTCSGEQAIVISRINSLLGLMFLWDLLTIRIK